MNGIQQKLLNSQQARHRYLFFALFGLLGISNYFVADLCVPSLPFIAKSLSASPTSVQWTVSSYLCGLGLFQLIFGPLSDRFGRRHILLVGISIALLGSIFCIIAPNVYTLILGRFIQGAGLSAVYSLLRSILRDCFSGIELIRVGSYVSMLFAIGPTIAPVFGSHLQHWFGWRMVFLALMLYILLLFIIVWWLLPETNQTVNLQAHRLKVIVSNYGQLLKHRVFLVNILNSSVALSGLLIYNVIGPFLLQEQLGLTVIQYGWLAIGITLAMILGRFINGKLVLRVSSKGLILSGNALMWLSSISMLIGGLLGYLNVIAIVGPILLFVFGNNFVLLNASANAMMPFKTMAGAASALFGCLQILGTFIATAIAAHLEHHSQTMMAMLLLTLVSLSSVVFYCFGRKE